MNEALRTGGAVLAALFVLWGLSKLRVYLDVGAGYKAKALCTAVFGSGRDLDPQRAAQIHDDSYWLLRPFTAVVDRDARKVTASLFGVRPRTVVHRQGFGSTLLALDAPLGPVPPAVDPQAAVRTWRHAPGHVPLQRFVDEAFTEPNPRRLRRTYAVVVVHDGQIVAERYADGITADTWDREKAGIVVRRQRL